ncbi:MAG: tetratricopeptide repeat protein [Candidatus Thorarchaeota archaeon]|nr:tetratricopeptide repeat protein [Candidatus Thorarchaeota archaeon]
MTEESKRAILDAMGAAMKGDTRRARVILKRLIKQEPDNIEALIALGALLNTAKETAEEAMKFLIKAVKIDQRNPIAWGHLGESLLLLKKYDRAEKYIRKALELAPEGANYWHRLGIVLDKSGRKEEAVEALEKSIEIAPSEDTTWISMGLVYLRMKDSDKAIEAFEKALLLSPENPVARNELEQVTKMKDDEVD